MASLILENEVVQSVCNLLLLYKNLKVLVKFQSVVLFHLHE